MHLKQLFAACLRLKILYSIAIIILCTTTTAQAGIISPRHDNIYVRMEVVVSNVANYGDSHVWFFYRDVTLKIQFFSDEACTQPYTLTTPADYKIAQTGFYETLSSSGSLPTDYIEGTVPAGESEYIVSETVFEEENSEFHNGELFDYSLYVYDYELQEAGYAIVVPAVVYPSHPF
jgi:hypothetical protein